MRHIRNAVFWAHLVVGLAVGLGVALMAGTGAILAFEFEVVGWAESGGGAAPSPGAARLPVETLLQRARELEPKAGNPEAVLLIRGDDAPVAVQFPKGAILLINGYTGDKIGNGAVSLRAFFRFVTELHRWLTLSGEWRDTGKMITGSVALSFLLLVLSGLILWVPRKLRWPAWRAVLYPSLRLKGKTRDWNWHNALGLWAAGPLVLITVTGAVIGFQWANDLVFRLAGDTPPPRREPAKPNKASAGAASAAKPSTAPATRPAAAPPNYAGLNAIWDRTYTRADPGWQFFYFRIADPRVVGVSVSTAGNFEIPVGKIDLTFDRKTGELRSSETYETMSPGKQARSLMLPIHRGVIGGIGFQIVLFLTALATLVLVYTGFALAWRRLIRPLWKRPTPTDAAAIEAGAASP
jgi:uncharacterized iron-regulated membrane protein